MAKTNKKIAGNISEIYLKNSKGTELGLTLWLALALPLGLNLKKN